MVAALDRIAVDLEEADRPELDHDTRGVPGSPDIVATILAKIEAAAVFVADVTPIAVSANGKHLANPNVLIELGYAKRALGTDRVILIWNTAFTNPRPEDLPFDMRHRRGPISYSLAAGATTVELRTVRADLSRRIEERLRASLEVVPAPPPTTIPWHERDEKEPSIWRDGSAPLVVNRGHIDGTTRMSMEGAPRGYARLIPHRWSPAPEALSILEGNTTHLIPLGRTSGINWGPTRGGFLAYRSSERIEEAGLTPTATRWFQRTGELWGVAASFFTEHEGSYVFAPGYAAAQWSTWMEHALRICPVLGGAGPFNLEIGLDGLAGTVWPDQQWGRRAEIEALEDRVQHEFVLSGNGKDEIAEAISVAFVKVTGAYGLSPMSPERFAELLGHR